MLYGTALANQIYVRQSEFFYLVSLIPGSNFSISNSINNRKGLRINIHYLIPLVLLELEQRQVYLLFLALKTSEQLTQASGCLLLCKLAAAFIPSHTRFSIPLTSMRMKAEEALQSRKEPPTNQNWGKFGVMANCLNIGQHFAFVKNQRRNIA